MSDYNSQVYVEQGSTKMVVESGGEVEFQSGSLLDIQSGSSIQGSPTLKGSITLSTAGGKVIDQNISVVSTANSTATQTNGTIVVNTTRSIVLSTPVDGAQKKVIFVGTTGKPMYLRTGSTAIFFNSSNGKDFIIKVVAETSKVSNHGLEMNLHANSTDNWWVGAGFGSTTQWTIDFLATT